MAELSIILPFRSVIILKLSSDKLLETYAYLGKKKRDEKKNVGTCIISFKKPRGQQYKKR